MDKLSLCIVWILFSLTITCYTPLQLNLFLIHSTYWSDVSTKKAKNKIKMSFFVHGLWALHPILEINPCNEYNTIAKHECSYQKKSWHWRWTNLLKKRPFIMTNTTVGLKTTCQHASELLLSWPLLSLQPWTRPSFTNLIPQFTDRFQQRPASTLPSSQHKPLWFITPLRHYYWATGLRHCHHHFVDTTFEPNPTETFCLSHYRLPLSSPPHYFDLNPLWSESNRDLLLDQCSPATPNFLSPLP